MSRRGFTLVELLVVVSIVVVLIGILIPALVGAQRSARSAVCLTRMKQVGLSTRMYGQDHQQTFPRSSHSALAHGVMPWGYALSSYLGQGAYVGPGAAWDRLFNGLYRCPEDSRRVQWSYGLNAWLELSAGEISEISGVNQNPVYSRFDRIPQPGATMMYGELSSGSMADHIMAHF